MHIPHFFICSKNHHHSIVKNGCGDDFSVLVHHEGNIIAHHERTDKINAIKTLLQISIDDIMK